MSRSLIITLTFTLMLASSAPAADNPFKALWPFNSNKSTATKRSSKSSFRDRNPFTKLSTSKKTSKSSKSSGLDRFSPTRMIDKAQQQTRKSWQGLQDFGASLNPLSSRKSKKPKKSRKPEKRTSFLDVFMPKTEPESPSTMGEFMNMQRPGF